MNTNTQSGLILSKDNPFISELTAQQGNKRTMTRSQTSKGTLMEEEYTMTVKRSYLPFPFTKLYQNRELLEDLSPDACKVVIHIALKLGYQEEKIELTSAGVGLERRRLAKALFELITRRVLVREKRSWYWVNITLLIVGNLAPRT